MFGWLRQALGGQVTEASRSGRMEPVLDLPVPIPPIPQDEIPPTTAASSMPDWLAALPRRVLVIDTETTGVTRDDRVVTFAGILMDTASLAEGRVTTRHLHLVFNPERPCHPRARAVQGYDDWTLSHQPRFAEEAETVESMFAEADQVVAHNASFDMRFMRREFEIAGRDLPERPAFCTMQAWRRSGLEGSSGLANAASHFGMVRAGEQHGAHEDAYFSLAVYLGLQTPIRLPGFEAVQTPGLSNLRAVPSRPRAAARGRRPA